MSALVGLQTLWLYDNQLSGSIPDLSALVNLQELYLFANQLSGSIPDLSALVNLRSLELDYNQLSGPIPDLSTLVNLQWLRLGHNQLSGNIPISLTTLSELSWLQLANNCLTASEPAVVAFLDSKEPGWETTQNKCSSTVSSDNNFFELTNRNGIATPTIGFGVNAVTGNFFHEEVDATLPGKEIPFVFSRAYNSLTDNKDSFGVELPQPLGAGWTHAYNILIRTDGSDSRAEVVWGDGRRDGFSKTSGVWQASTPGNFATLTEVSGQPYAWELTTKGQTHYRFDANQRLTAIVGRNGYSLQLVYNMAGDLATITDTAGRTIQFTHSAGRLTKITLPGKTPLSRTIEFAYFGDLLNEVKDMKGHQWRYTYQGQKLRRIYQANANTSLDNKVALQIDYDAQGRVDKQQTGHHLIASNAGYYYFNWSQPNRLEYRSPTAQGAELVWDDQQRVVKITPINTPGAKTQDISYSTDSGPESVFPAQMDDQEDNPYSLTYANTDLKTLKPPLGSAYALQYNGTHDMTTVTTPKGVNIGLPRDAAGKPTAITAQSGGIVHPINTTLNYYGSGEHRSLLHTMNTANGVKTEVAAYHIDGQPLEIRRYVNASQFLSTFYTYDAAGRLVSEKDHRGVLTCYDYDNNDNVTHILEGVMGNCPSNLAGQAATAALHHTCFGYDDNNRQTTLTERCGNTAQQRTRTYFYNDNSGILHRIEDHGSSRRLDLRYDNDLQLTTITHKVTGREDRRYRLASGRIRITADNQNGSNQTLSRIERREYDGNGQLIAVSSCNQIDDQGEPSSDCSGKKERLRYFRDALGRPTQIKELIDYEGNSRATDYHYSADGRTITVTPQVDDTSTVYQYDGLGRLISATQKKGGETYTSRAEYDASGRLIKVIDPQGLATLYTYDGLGRMVSRQDVQGTTRWTYNDANGTVTQTMDADTAVITYSYNPLYQVVQIIAQNPATAENNTFQLTYNSKGQLRKESWTGSGGTGQRVYTYNRYGELTQVAGPFNQVIDYTRDELGRVTKKAFTGDFVTYSYDAFSRIKMMGGTFLASGLFDFRYDDYTHALTKMTFPNGVVTTYPRNPLGELTGLETTNPNGGKHLAYNFAFNLKVDARKNRWRRDTITATQPIAPAFVPETLNFGFDTAFGRLNTVNNAPMSYDKRGNLTALPAPMPGTYAYDALNRLTTVGSTQHRYDTSRTRIETIRQGTTTRYLWDMNSGLPDLLATLNQNDEIQNRYLHGPGGLLAHKDSSGQIRFIHQDFNANVVAMTNAQGQIDSAYAYTPYGKAAGLSGDNSFPFRFAGSVGAMTDPEGVIYMRARYYHSGLRQFTSADLVPGNLAKPQSLGRYNYVEGMALTGVDPSGLAATSYQECAQAMRAQGTRTRPEAIREMCSKYNNSLSLIDFLPSWEGRLYTTATTGFQILEENGISKATTLKITNRINATFKTTITPKKLGGFLEEGISLTNLAFETVDKYNKVLAPVDMVVKAVAMKNQPVEYTGELLQDTAALSPMTAITAGASVLPAMMDREFAENVVEYAPQGITEIRKRAIAPKQVRGLGGNTAAAICKIPELGLCN